MTNEGAGGDVGVDSPPSVHAIVLVPGFQRAERFDRRNALTRGLCALEGRRLEPAGERAIDGEVGLRLVDRDAPNVEVHVFEAYWADMFTEVAAPSPWSRLLQGFGLVGYWMNVRMVRALRISRYMTFGLVGGGLVLVLWYVSTFVLAAQAIAGDAALTPDGVPSRLLGGVVWLGDRIGGWKLWATVTLLLPVLRADELARLAAFARRYLEDQGSDADVGLRARVRQRVQATIDHIVDARYTDVLVVAHSFGTIVANDIFADRRPAHGDPKLALVTWGSPAAVMQCRSGWLRSEVQRLAVAPSLARWEDVYSDGDWLCAAHPARKESALPGQATRIDFDASMVQRLTGRTHVAYYSHPRALAALVAPWQGPIRE